MGGTKSTETHSEGCKQRIEEALSKSEKGRARLKEAEDGKSEAINSRADAKDAPKRYECSTECG